LSAGRPTGQAEDSSKRNIFALVESKLIDSLPGAPEAEIVGGEGEAPPEVSFPGKPIDVGAGVVVDGGAVEFVATSGETVLGNSEAGLVEPGVMGGTVLGPTVSGAVEATGSPGSAVDGVTVDDTGTTEPGSAVSGDAALDEFVAGLVEPCVRGATVSGPAVSGAVEVTGGPGSAGDTVDDAGATEPSDDVSGKPVLGKVVAGLVEPDRRGATVLGPVASGAVEVTESPGSAVTGDTVDDTGTTEPAEDVPGNVVSAAAGTIEEKSAPGDAVEGPAVPSSCAFRQ
jgi:hypothetical protein